MPDLLIELFSEEIPARLQARAAADLQKLVTNGLVEAGLTYAHAGAFHTSRRLTLTVEGLLAASPTTREERKGPRTDATIPRHHSEPLSVYENGREIGVTSIMRRHTSGITVHELPFSRPIPGLPLTCPSTIVAASATNSTPEKQHR